VFKLLTEAVEEVDAASRFVIETTKQIGWPSVYEGQADLSSNPSQTPFLDNADDARRVQTTY
jgi:hypothetical protein